MMASIIIRGLDGKIKERLRKRASSHGCSMEEEAREILKIALKGSQTVKRDLGRSSRAV